MAQRFYSPRTARLALRTVRPAAESLQRLVRRMEALKPSGRFSDRPVDAGYFRLLLRLHAIVDGLRAEGVEVKDLRAGLVDFRARRAGRAVLLCWRVGEDELGFWHEPEGGFAGRRPVDEDGPWEEWEGEAVPPGGDGPL